MRYFFNMRNKVTVFIIFFALGKFSVSQQQHSEKTLNAVRAIQPVSVKDEPDAPVWLPCIPASGFIQINPENGQVSQFNTLVYMLYDDKALYIKAELFTGGQQSVNQLSQRDEFAQSDFFGVYIDPYGDAKTAYGFFVTQPGVQIDVKINYEGDEDTNWDAVWESNTLQYHGKWVALLKIPYSALRFPSHQKQAWRINFFRNDVATREKSSWCFMDRKIENNLALFGVVEGIENIQPPLRLSFSPYIAGYTENQSDRNEWNHSLKGGLDVKLGFFENYTLDMMLIPDFGQVPSDDKVLNLTPFETYYDEKRPFFTEGTELFEKAEIFYSRRIGGTPKDYYRMKNLPDSIEVIENPMNTQLINATKISGKSSSGLGLGFINAMTSNTYCTVKDSLTGNKHNILTQPFSNYNLIVADQSIGKNSYISFINNNLYMPDWNYTANVSGIDFKMSTKDGKYAVSGIGNLSYINDRNKADSTGYRYAIVAGKTSGSFTFTLSQNVESDRYNPNDMGYLQNPNEFTNSITAHYNIYKPRGILLEMNNYLDFTHSMLYNPKKFTDLSITYQNVSTFTNYLTASLKTEFQPVGAYDYFEARVPGRVFNIPRNTDISGWISPDYRKAFLVDCSGGYTFASGTDRFQYYLSAGPRIRFNDRFFLIIGTKWSKLVNDEGFYKQINKTDSIIFSRRDVNTWTNSVTASYYFNHKSNISLRARHYWSRVKNHSYHTLLNDGELSPEITGFSGRDRNYNAFSTDLVFNWHFAPGSNLSLVWKNAIHSEENVIDNRYFDNFNHMITSTQSNNFSVKILYYIDYLSLTKKNTGKV